MRIGQIRWNSEITAAIFDNSHTRPIPGHTLLDLIVRSEVENTTLPQLASSLASQQRVQATPIIPIKPVEVWACGCTYEMSASFRDAEHNTREGFYAYVFEDRKSVV